MVKARLIIEVAGWPSEAVEKALLDLVEKIKSEGKSVIKETYAKAEKIGEKMFSAFLEIEINFKNLDELFGMAVDYAPNSLEILETNDIKLKIGELQTIINDIALKIHSLDQKVQYLAAQNITLARSVITSKEQTGKNKDKSQSKGI